VNDNKNSLGRSAHPSRDEERIANAFAEQATAETSPSGGFDWDRAKQRLADLAATLQQIEQVTPQQAKLLMDERARDLALDDARSAVAEDALEILSFQMGDEQFAIETKYIYEVGRWRETTTVPGAPDFMVGLVNLRGDMLAVIDLRHIFGIERRAPTDLTRLIVLGRDRIELSICADAVAEVSTLRPSDVLEAPGSATGFVRDLLLGVTNDAQLVLDGEVLLNDRRLYIEEKD
jgi:purine-binding chemotaxis protein CheW